MNPTDNTNPTPVLPPAPVQQTAPAPSSGSSKKVSNWGRSIFVIGWFFMAFAIIGIIGVFQDSSTLSSSTRHVYFVGLPLDIIASVVLIMQGRKIKRSLTDIIAVRGSIVTSLFAALFILAVAIIGGIIVHAKNDGIFGFFSLVLSIYLLVAWFQSKKIAA